MLFGEWKPQGIWSLLEMTAPGGIVVLIGMPPETVRFDVVRAKSRGPH